MLFRSNKNARAFITAAESIFGATGKIIKSVNGGLTWIQVGPTYQDAMLGGMFFLNSNYGFLGMYESVSGLYNPTSTTWLSTLNGGSTFNSSVVPSSISYWNFGSDFPDANVGYMSRSTYVGTDPVYIRKTTNGGTSWTENAIAGYNGSIYALDFLNADTGFIVGADGAILRTIDGSSTWTMLNTGNFNNLHSVCMINNNLGFAAGDNGTILRYGANPTAINQLSATKTNWFIFP